ncbi:MAG: glycine betaine ABC transporter substrate-binding protein [Chloroflexota bacterium]
MKKLLGLLLVLVLVISSISVVAAQDDEVIQVGSKQFTEQLVLGQLMLIALEEAGYEVEDNTNLGGTAVNREALLAGEIDVYAEYTGTAISNYFNEVPFVDQDEIVSFSGDAYASYAIVSSLDAAINDMVWLQPAPMNNTYSFAVMTSFANENSIYTAQDLADYLNAGNELQLSTMDEFAQRPDGLRAYENTYGFEIPEQSQTVIAGGTPAQTSQQLNEGQADIAVVYSTDGALLAYQFTVLEDPSGAQPVFAPAPVFRGEVLRANPEIATILNPIFATLDTTTMQSLNGEVEVGGQDPRTVAETYLRDNGFID